MNVIPKHCLRILFQHQIKLNASKSLNVISKNNAPEKLYSSCSEGHKSTSSQPCSPPPPPPCSPPPSEPSPPPTASLPGTTPFCVPCPPRSPFSVPPCPCPTPGCPPACPPCPPPTGLCSSPCSPCIPICPPLCPPPCPPPGKPSCSLPCPPCTPPCTLCPSPWPPCTPACPPCIPPSCITPCCPTPFVVCNAPCGPACCPCPNLPTCPQCVPSLCCPVSSPPCAPPCPKYLPPPSNLLKMIMLATKLAMLFGAILWTYNEGVWGNTVTTDKTYRRWLGGFFGLPADLPCACENTQRLPTHDEITRKVAEKCNTRIDNTMKTIDPWVRKEKLPGCKPKDPKDKTKTEEPPKKAPVKKDNKACTSCGSI